MQFKLTIVLLALCAFASGSHLRSPKHHLSQFALQSRAAIEGNPSRSVECFGEYMDTVTEITTVYEEEYAKCASDSEDSITALDATYAGDRDGLTNAAGTACQLFTECNTKERAFDFFTCYVSAGNEASRSTFSISGKAEQLTKDVAQKQAQIIYIKDQCDSDCKTKYEQSAATCWTTLQNCVNAPPAALESKAAVHSKVMKQALKKH